MCGISGAFSTNTAVYQAMIDNMIQPDVVLTAPSETFYVKQNKNLIIIMFDLKFK
jgi:hypothetical protein